MSPLRFFPALVPLVAAAQNPSVTLQRERGATYEQVFEDLRRMAPRADQVATVRGLVLRRDVAEFRMEDGTLQLLSDVAGRTVAVAFSGRGSWTFAPPLDVERAHLKRVLGDSTVSGPVTAMVFIFTDSTLGELERSVRFAAGSSADGVAGRVGAALDFLVDGRERSTDPTLMWALLDGAVNGFFAAYVKRESGEDLLFEVDPHQVEEIYLFRRGKITGQRIETVCQFQRAEDLRDRASPSTEQRGVFKLEGYRIDAAIDNNYNFSASATVRLTSRRPEVRWVLFQLFSPLEVDSVVTEAGAALAFFRRDRNSDLWVRFDPAVRQGETRAVRVVYHGDVIAHGSVMDQMLPPWWSADRRRMPPMMDNWAFIRNTSTWYPRYSFWQPADMDMTFRTPRGLRFASIGRQVESRTAGDTLITRWVTELPTQQASFNIGELEEFEIRDPRIPPVTVHINREAHRSISALLPHARNPQEWVGTDVANSLSFFSAHFGPPLFQRYYATEIPYFHGQAFPGMIHLSWATFISVADNGSNESFRAHEMAHQWWGIGVEPATYRDAWLSEGFAEFSGLWYMQTALRDNEKYFRQLREARQELHRERNRAVPIGLGLRALESTRGRYDLVVYQKGAWILHMLRNLMVDLRTMSDSAFTAMLRDYYETFRGRSATTRDFQEVVERHVGGPMDWFFDQWVNGTAIPTYAFSWRAEPLPDGRYLLRMRVRQEDTPEHFTMIVPVLVQFAGGGQTIVRVQVRGPLTETQVRVPVEPTRLELNALESVLAEVREERWR
ncbi:MAG: M1 family aminopeptidase [Gemmatimonadales bacterium]